jgi:radical SAM superfamily enzyme YgiQ (UPF0313 family)
MPDKALPILFNPRAQRAHRRLPLSILSLARVLPDALLIDANVEVDWRFKLDQACSQPGAVLLVTVMPGPQLAQVVPLCRSLKRRFPGLVIVWGGYFPTVYPEVCTRDPGVDFVVIGQGERSIGPLLEAISAGREPEVSGVAWFKNGRFLKTRHASVLRSSDFGRFPYERLELERYAARTFLGNRTFNHHSSTGCPYHCNFCAVVSMFDGRWLPDPAEAVLESVLWLVEHANADAIEFHDNNFFVWEKRCKEVADGLKGKNLRWWGEGRIDTMLGFSGETWESMAQSGLFMVFYGAESPDQEALDRMDKGGLKVGDVRELNRLAKRFGVRPEFSFMVGNPGDPEGEIVRTIALVRDLKQDNSDCEIILYLYTPVPLPGQFDKATAAGFAFPETLDGWLRPPWGGYAHRRDPRTPWLTTKIVRSLHDFEAVLHARFPTASDLNLSPARRSLLQALALPRWKSGIYAAPIELKALQKLFSYRKPEEMGF